MAVVFDFDGVLVDSVAPVTSSINAALREHDLAERPLAELLPLIGPPTFVAFSGLLAQPPDAPLVAEVVATYRRHYESVYLTQTPVFDGVAAMLEELSRHFALALATSKSSDFARPLLEAVGLAQHFTVVSAAAPFSADEDKSAIVARALEELGEDSGAMVGDRSFDMVAARAHGLRALGAGWGVGSESELRDAGAETVVATPGELVALLVGDAAAR